MKDRSVIGEDARLKFVAKKLTDDTRTVFYKKSSKWDDDVQQAYNELMPTKMILPIHPLHVDDDVRIKPITEVFIGKSNDTWKSILQIQRYIIICNMSRTFGKMRI